MLLLKLDVYYAYSFFTISFSERSSKLYNEYTLYIVVTTKIFFRYIFNSIDRLYGKNETVRKLFHFVSKPRR